ncbi:4-hydroxy-3-methylbut-2-enyl diphosphate reductase [Clostridium baratii]|uniref:bifunctional 4-hydroxy-3-methylbut-2-enyl diphosphate reductase/30S ribosomal protein S1 n=1 Tax=Clostridium baratii TaxID=1561 RepID=UPI0009A46E5C|nr:bifunctional 4-hydroxy-3-methylbut-2-enyl diphosphate reductase/30S ribosomal protein S1 [Clostridium baratii]OPF51653.1 4-hydroxy-3-methylbut-2-enyl diphosphate reductase [Clostridium baratii]OPF55275.1 4-hydroxy-3-methylbut-2-enyl diphosphate reductase [Clostridium baratii]OPF57558.1 4-hydroxy-3-methylbut-2-enyl diphosphate reductase [Clostridium baratii]OPF60344.1 4-hydroxy-3-methylbut-2-enyl diphosphate reductase [Clostridium baratii]
MKKVILAENAGFCFGVQRAVETSIDIKKKYNKKIYTLGPLIHNSDVVSFLEQNDIYAIDYENINDLQEGDVVIIRSHGIPEAVFNDLKSRGLEVIDATCPFVTNIQKKVKKYSKEGYNIIIVGDENHPEVIGINGWCDNKATITKNGEFNKELSNKICAVSQTTEKKENWDKTLDAIDDGTREVLSFNTICSATEVRQKSADDLSKEVDAMIVIGGKNSSNTTKLYEIAKHNCENTIHIENSNELPKEYINNKNFKKIGITAGASTPDWIIREVINIMQDEKNFNDEQLKLMNEMDKTFRIGDEIEGEILTISKDGVSVSLVGYKSDGIIPFEELTAKMDPREYAKTLNVGDTIKAKVIKLGNVVLSRLEYEKDEILNDLEELFKNQTIFPLTISEVKEKGLVGYYNGIRVFVPASQIDIKFVNDKEIYKGQTLDVKLIDFNKENPSRVVASRRKVQEEAKEANEEKVLSSLKVGDIVKAEVKRFTNFGAFAEVNGVDGLIHLSQISWNHVKRAEDYLKSGDIIDVKVIELDKENKKLSLSIKEITPEPWKNVTEKYPEGSVVLGKVVRINDFGAFVELEPGVDGLVHISKISHDRINNPADVLSVGQDIKAKILSVDEEQKRISLSMKDV